MAKTQRQSNIELLRSFSMFCIIVYHVFIFALAPIDDTSLYQALQLPFHIGVPLFVMISGYFGIRFSLRGLARLFSKAYFYFGLLGIIPMLFAFPGVKNFLTGSMIFSFSHYWFLNCYLYLFLLSPIINVALQRASNAQRGYLLAILAFMSIYIGNVTQGDGALLDGKNLTNFMLLYAIGNTLRHFQAKTDALSMRCLLGATLVFNVCLVVGFMYVPALAGKIWKYGFAYNSPLMMLNCALVFMVFSKLQLQSRFVNWMGGSIFACYLIHCPGLVWENVFVSPMRSVYASLGQPWLVIPCVLVYVAVAMLLMVSIDHVLSPLWKAVDRKAAQWDEKWQIKDRLNRFAQ